MLAPPNPWLQKKGVVKNFSFVDFAGLFQVVIQDGGTDEIDFHKRIR
jgi:hypothetical protein